MIHPSRIFDLNRSEKRTAGNVIYWMSRDQRCRDNWALLHARELAEKTKGELAVVFCLTPDFPGAALRHYSFMLEGLREVSQSLQLLNIPFYILRGDPVDKLVPFIRDHHVSHVVTEFDPVRIKRAWKKRLAGEADINLLEVDAHNIVPARLVSDKLEYSAATFRPKLKKLLHEYLIPFPEITPQQKTTQFRIQQPDWKAMYKSLKTDSSVKAVDWIHPGEDAAHDLLSYFISEKISQYPGLRNDPNEDATSNLSPYLHFGQISAQRIALEVRNRRKYDDGTDEFLEELIVRRELSDNYCHYNPTYDTLENIPAWARETLDAHRNDEREYIFEKDQFENAATSDPLWNAAQREMITTGKMHGYMRMYWSKKILEWTPSPEIAMEYSLYLNDKYELDGRDPNGYTGCAWSVAGVHDRPWKERPVFGKIRYMNYNGARRKFDVREYIQRWSS